MDFSNYNRKNWIPTKEFYMVAMSSVRYNVFANYNVTTIEVGVQLSLTNIFLVETPGGSYS